MIYEVSKKRIYSTIETMDMIWPTMKMRIKPRYLITLPAMYKDKSHAVLTFTTELLTNGRFLPKSEENEK